MQARKRSEIRGTRTSALLGWLIGRVMKSLAATLRLRVRDEAGLTDTARPLPPVIYLLWHSRFLIVPPAWRKLCGRSRRVTILTSASKDGDMVARAMAAFGFDAARGSSSRRGVAALIALKKALRAGHDVTITPDGPKGPRYRLQSGAIALAHSTGAPVVPVHVRFHSAWRLKTWDRFVIPKPFSRVEVTFAEPVDVATLRATRSEEEVREHLEGLLIAGTDDA